MYSIRVAAADAVTDLSLGSQAAVEAGSAAGPLAQSAIPRLVLGPHEYRQCEDRRSDQGAGYDSEPVQCHPHHLLRLVFGL